MPRRTFKKWRERQWEKDPRCFWCGEPTILVDVVGGPSPPNAATVDHIRSKLNPARTITAASQRPGICVLSCYKCNHERGRLEVALLGVFNPEALRERCGSKPANLELLNAQAALCATVLRFLRNGGQLDGKHANYVRARARDLEKIYYGGNGDPRKPDHIAGASKMVQANGSVADSPS